MKALKPISPKKSTKKEREHHVLIGLVKHYLETGQPVGSNTLKEADFENLSSATIRNYFASLEKEGFLKQQHVSGGRIPTQKAFRVFAEEHYDAKEIISPYKETFEALKNNEGREIATYLQNSAETLSSLSKYAIFMSAPRFDHDYIVNLKLVPVDFHRFLSVVITDFGVIQTELLHSEKKMSAFSLKRIESYFHWRLTNHDKPENLEEEELETAQKYYNEVMVRYIVGYSTFIDEEIYRTGFSRLLQYPDFHENEALATTLSLFENAHSMRLLLRECASCKKLKYWVGDDLMAYAPRKPNCTVIAVPYYINNQPVGAVGMLGPMRLPYHEMFPVLRGFSEAVSKALTCNIYKFKISYRDPQQGELYMQKEEHNVIGQSRLMLLEDKSKKEKRG